MMFRFKKKKIKVPMPEHWTRERWDYVNKPLEHTERESILAPADMVAIGVGLALVCLAALKLL